MTNEKAIIAIPMGDPAGIGPEITAKSLINSEIYDKCKPLVVGDAEVFTKAIEIVNGNLDINVINSPEEGKYEHGTVDLIDLNNIKDRKSTRLNSSHVAISYAVFCL